MLKQGMCQKGVLHTLNVLIIYIKQGMCQMGVLHTLNVLIIYKKNADHQKQQPSLSLQVEPAIH
jgi:hypothetical protein